MALSEAQVLRVQELKEKIDTIRQELEGFTDDASDEEADAISLATSALEQADMDLVEFT